MLMPSGIITLHGRGSNAIVLDVFDGKATIMKIDDSEDMSQRTREISEASHGAKNKKGVGQLWQLKKAAEVQAQVSKHHSYRLQPRVV